MAEPTLAVQTTIRERLTGSPDVLAIVQAESIFDRHTRPEANPCIIIGEGHVAPSDDYSSFHELVVMDLHIWAKEPGFRTVKTLADHVEHAIRAPGWIVEGHLCHKMRARVSRFLRDPDGEHSHGVLTVEAILQRRAAA